MHYSILLIIPIIPIILIILLFLSCLGYSAWIICICYGSEENLQSPYLHTVSLRSMKFIVLLALVCTCGVAVEVTPVQKAAQLMPVARASAATPVATNEETLDIAEVDS